MWSKISLYYKHIIDIISLSHTNTQSSWLQVMVVQWLKLYLALRTPPRGKLPTPHAQSPSHGTQSLSGLAPFWPAMLLHIFAFLGPASLSLCLLRGIFTDDFSLAGLSTFLLPAFPAPPHPSPWVYKTVAAFVSGYPSRDNVHVYADAIGSLLKCWLMGTMERQGSWQRLQFSLLLILLLQWVIKCLTVTSIFLSCCFSRLLWHLKAQRIPAQLCHTHTHDG